MAWKFHSYAASCAERAVLVLAYGLPGGQYVVVLSACGPQRNGVGLAVAFISLDLNKPFPGRWKKLLAL